MTALDPLQPGQCPDCRCHLTVHHVDRLDAELGRSDRSAINWCETCGGACRVTGRVA